MPVTTISFGWALNQFRSISMDIEDRKRLSNAEHAFLFSLYLAGVISLSDEECKRDVQQSRLNLLTEYQTLCEEALSRTNLLCMTDITVLKALALYMVIHDSLTIYSSSAKYCCR